jgi:T5SS/PEP-CTERM-associated repeat protein
MQSNPLMYWLQVGLCMGAVCLCLPSSNAQTNSWIAGTGKWETNSNWSAGVRPSSTQAGIFVTNASSKTVTIDSLTSGSFPLSMTVSNLTVSGVGGSSNTLSLFNAGTNTPLEIINGLTITNGSVLMVTNSAVKVDGVLSNVFLIEGQMFMANGALVTVSNSSVTAGMRVGSNPGASGTLTVGGGTLTTVGANLYAGHDTGSVGVIWVGGGNIAGGQKIDVALSGTGQMTVSNGAVSAVTLIVAELGGSQGTLTLAGGSVTETNDSMILGRLAAATGTVWVTGGQMTSVNTNGLIAIEVGGSGVGQMTVSNGTVLAGQIMAGCEEGGLGTLTIAGGTVTANSGLFAAGTNTSQGAIWVTGGQVFVTNTFVDIGFQGAGQLAISNGNVTATNMIVADYPGSQGSFTMAGGQLTLSGFLNIGNVGGTGTVVVSGGTLTANNAMGNLSMASNGVTVGFGGIGQWTMTNGTAFLSPLIVGGSANGTLTLSGGNLFTAASNTEITSGLALGNGQGVTGTVWVSGGLLAVTNSSGTEQLEIGSFGVGHVTASGGVVRANSIFVGSFPGSEGTLTLAGGTVIADRMRLGTNNNTVGTLQVNSGTLTVLSGSTNALLLGDAQGATGVVTVAGGSIVATNISTQVGSLGTGQMTVSNGVVMTGQTAIGAGTNTQGSLTLSGGNMTVLSNLTAAAAPGSQGAIFVRGGQLTATNGVIGIGNDGTATNGFGVGTATVSNGTVLANQILLGSAAGGHGNLTIQPNGMVSLVGSNALLVPDDVDIDGGELDINNGEIVCGSATNFPGSLTMFSGAASAYQIYVGSGGAGTLTISGGQMSASPLMDIGFNPGSAGSVWMSGGTLTAGVIILGDSGVGQLSLSNNGIIQVSSSFSVGASGAPGAAGTLRVAGGSLTVSVPVYVGAGSVWVSAGQLQAASLLLGYNNYGVGQMTISNGSVQANSLILTNGANSQIALVGGTLESGGTVVTNTQRFVVGNGSSPATFGILGGTHWFGTGLEIGNSATLTGCGTINGSVIIDLGAHSVATCGKLTFAGPVTINGVARALNGSVLSFNGAVVNNGAIDVLNGSATFSVPPTGTGYILTTNCLPAIASIQQVGPDIHISFTTGTNAPYTVSYETDLVTGTWTTLTNVTGTGGTSTVIDSGATLLPKRFYRVNLVVPP